MALYKIIDGIYLSNLHDAQNLNLIKDNKIKLVIRLSDDVFNENIYDNSIIFKNIELEDNIFSEKEMINTAKKVFNMINSFDENILIHCNEGKSRSVSIIIYYLIKQYNYSYDKAYNYIKNIKSDVCPNIAFQNELRKISCLNN